MINMSSNSNPSSPFILTYEFDNEEDLVGLNSSHKNVIFIQKCNFYSKM